MLLVLLSGLPARDTGRKHLSSCCWRMELAGLIGGRLISPYGHGACGGEGGSLRYQRWAGLGRQRPRLLRSVQKLKLGPGSQTGKKRGRIRWMAVAIPVSLCWTLKQTTSQVGIRTSGHGEVGRQRKERGKGADRNHFQQAQGSPKSQTKAKLIGTSTDSINLDH